MDLGGPLRKRRKVPAKVSTIPGSHRSCFEWTVETNRFDAQCDTQRSSEFRVRHREFHLRLQFYNRCYYLHIKPGLVGHLRDVCIDVHAVALWMPPVVLIQDTPCTESLLWTSSEKDVEAQCRCFSSFVDGRLKFLVSGVDPVKRCMNQVESSVQTSLNLNAISCLESLSTDLAGLIQDQDSRQDVLLVCGDKSVRAHSNVIRARSKVFDATFRSDMIEAETGQIDVRDMDCDTFERFMRYIYTGTVPDLTLETARGLYEAADRYDVPSLKRRCSGFLQEHLAPENACETLKLADAHGDQSFKQAVTDYIISEEIFRKGEHWNPFCNQNPSLANQVLNCYYRILKTPTVFSKPEEPTT